MESSRQPFGLWEDDCPPLVGRFGPALDRPIHISAAISEIYNDVDAVGSGQQCRRADVQEGRLPLLVGVSYAGDDLDGISPSGTANGPRRLVFDCIYARYGMLHMAILPA